MKMFTKDLCIDLMNIIQNLIIAAKHKTVKKNNNNKNMKIKKQKIF